MIIKCYIKKKLFHLPRRQNDLISMVKEEFYQKKTFSKDGITKLYPVTSIDNAELEFDKNINIFLLNLYLLVLEDKGKLDNIEIRLSNDNLLSELSSILRIDTEELVIDEIEKKVIEHLEGVENEYESVKFSIAWVKSMDKKIKG